jgi:hypothetical protein
MIYSLIDTFALKVLEDAVQDLQQIYSISQINMVRFEKALSQTTSIECKWRGSLLTLPINERKYILSNNTNRVSREETSESVSIRGAFVADPNKIKKVGVDLFKTGLKSNRLFRMVCDFDFSALYPTLTYIFRADYLNFVGKLQFAKFKSEQDDFKVARLEDNGLEEEAESVKLINIYLAKDWIKLGERYFNLPSMKELLSKFKI